MKKSSTAVAIGLLVLVGALWAGQWVPLDVGTPERAADFRVVSTNSRKTVVELELNGVYVTDVQADGQTWQTVGLGIAAGGLTGEEGSPQLPVLARFLKVPDDRAVSVRVTELDEAVLEGYRVYPLQPPLAEDQVSVPFVVNERRYGTDESYPEASYRVSDPMIMRDLRLVQLVLQPARYNPVSGELRVARRLRVELSYDGPGRVNVKRRTRSGVSRAFEPLYRKLVANYDYGPPQHPEDGSYLIIVHDNFASAVEPFAEWKRRKGWRTKVVTTSELGGNDSAHIDAYVTDAYNNWPLPPDYVLLVGDAQDYLVAPQFYFYGYWYATDLPYSCKEGGDVLADLMIGRVCVKTLTEAQTAMSKLYRYEMEPYMANTDWFDRVCAAAAYESNSPRRFWTVVMRIRDYVMSRPFAQFDTLFQRWNLSRAQAITDSLNQGRAWMLYRGHGDVDGWYNVSPPYVNSHVHALDNGRMTPIVIGPTCCAGDFDNPSLDCMGETWVKTGTPTEIRGGVGYFGSSDVSYSGYNDSLAAGAFMGYVDSLSYTFAQSTQWGKLFMLMAYPLPDELSVAEMKMFNNLGEPELNIWSAVPRQLEVSHPGTVLIGSFPFQVVVSDADDPVEDALVCVMSRQDMSVYHVGYTDASGSVQFTLNTTTPGDSVLVTVTGRNLHPYLGGAITISPSAAYVCYCRHEVHDSAPGGNGDGIVNPGEEVRIGMWVKNLGPVAADSVQGVVRTTDPNVSVIDSVGSFGAVGGNDSARTTGDGFGFTVAESCTNGYQLAFRLECRDDNDSVWNTGWFERIGTPILFHEAEVAVDSPPGGNGDGVFEPGETSDLMVVLRNTGLGHGYDFTGVLRAYDTRVQVLDSAGLFEYLPRDSTGMNENDRFRVHADDSMSIETVVPCTLLLSDGVCAETLGFELLVGAIRTTDPIPDGPRTPACYYAYDDVDSAYGQHPVYEWVEVRDIGTRLSLGDDDVASVNLPAGFFWYYYDRGFAQLTVGSNGYVCPGVSSFTSGTNEHLPCTGAPAMVAVNWDDLDPSTGGGVWYWYDSTADRFIVEYDSIRYADAGDTWDAFQVILHRQGQLPNRDNEILCQYRTAHRYTGSTVGIQDESREVAIECLYDDDYHRGAAPLEAGRAVRYTTDAPGGVAEGRTGASGVGGSWIRLEPSVGVRTAVRFGLARPGRVRLAVFDEAGRAVRTLFRSEMATGEYRTNWDGTDDRGSSVATGVYFVRLDADGRRFVDKLVLTD